VMKSEPVEQQENVGDSPNVAQEKSASSGSEGSDGFVKLDELEDAQPVVSEHVEDVLEQAAEQASEEFTKLTPSTDAPKNSLESKEMCEEPIEVQQAYANELQGATEEEVAKGDDVIGSDDTTTFKKVEEVEKPSLVNEKENEATDTSDSCKLYTILPTSVKRGISLSEVESREPVEDILYWQDVKVSAATFGFIMLALVGLSHSSALLVFSYISLSLLTVTMAVKIYHFVMQTVNGTQQPDPFQDLMDLDITISEERAHKYFGILLTNINNAVVCARDLFLVKKFACSFKFGLVSWVVGYVGSVFNTLTLVIIAVALAFTVPVVYQKNQTEIDQYLDMACKRVSKLYTTIRSSIPGLKSKSD